MAIQVFVPTFDVEGCLAEIRECLEKGWTGMGFKTLQFENDWKAYTGLNNAYFLGSATAGLNLCFEVLRDEYGWDENSEVITTPLTFVSSNHAILLAGLKAVFADVDDTLCLDPASVESKISKNTKAVLFVGLGGNTGEYESIVKLCRQHGLKLILDAAHMAGTRLHGEIPGREADCVVYSFQAVKNLPTADSGMICFMEQKLDETARKRAWLGINKDTYSRVGKGGNYKWKYDVEYVGRKDHGNSVMAAIGIVQLKHLDEDNEYRRRLAEWYEQGLDAVRDKVRLVRIGSGCVSSRHLFQIIVENRDELMQYLNEHEIFPGVHYIDNTQYRMYSYARGTCPRSEYYSERIISLPMHLRLSREDVDTVANTIDEYVKQCR